METSLKISLLLLLASSLCCFILAGGEDGSQLQTYIVHVQQPEGATPFLSSEDREAWYRSFLPQTAINSDVPRMVYSYQSAISGFAARLTAGEVKAMESKDGFLQAYPDRFLRLLTTHTPDFLGLHHIDDEGLWNDSRLGEGVIIGMLDTGITPGHPSFIDDGTMPSPPCKWKGACHLPANACNNKLIGARNFVNGSNESKAQPIDDDGHGTHTASTAAGSFVKNAAVLGQAKGTVVGMAPHAHLAIYKVCTSRSCSSSAIMAAIDAAIHDGVDVISMSLGGPSINFYQDSIAIASFNAMEKGIFVSCAAGNFGPKSMSVANGAPWVLTVGASTTDRTIRATVRLGDGRKIYGQSLYQPSNFSSSPLPLVRPNGSLCNPSALEAIDVKGKVVLCTFSRFSDFSLNVKEAGGAAVILMNPDYLGYSTFNELFELPASIVSHADGTKIEEYYNSTANPLASIIFEGTKIDNLQVPAPMVTAFSSRGPNLPSLGILKPDITGPGVDILAAWNNLIAPPSAAKEKTQPAAAFNMISGTSMSTPHLSGIAALLKSLHPDWSPAAIMSAIVTTADVVANDGERIRDEQMQPASYYAMGAGHVNATRASNPGLVYNLTAEDYIPYLCGLGYNDNQVTSVVGQRIKCSNVKSIAEWDLNYPSMVVSLGSKPVTVNRTVTNVGEPKSKYVVKVEAPAGVSVKVKPQKLHFSEANQTKKFTVSFSRIGETEGVGAYDYDGNLKWISEAYVVTSPIAVRLFEQQ